MPTPPDFPAGPPPTEPATTEAARRRAFAAIERAPAALRAAAEALPDLDAEYRNWTARQIITHLADSQAHIYLRFKLALAEDNPTVRPYDEGEWALLPDANADEIEAPLTLLAGVHAAWLRLLNAMTPSDFERTFFHPEMNETTPLSLALPVYAWHAEHHTAQLRWIAEHRR